MFKSPLYSATNKFAYASIEHCARSAQATFLLSSSVRRFYVIIVAMLHVLWTVHVEAMVMDLLGTTTCSTTCILNGLSPKDHVFLVV